MLFCVLDSRLFPCPRTHLLHVRKLAEGFVQNGYHFRILHDPSEMAWLSAADILYVSNHFATELLLRHAKKLLQQYLMSYFAQTRAKLVLWSFHTAPDWDALAGFPDQVLHLGEDLYPEAIAREPVLSAFRRRFPVVTLRYAAALHPRLSSRQVLEKAYDFNFVGHGYQRTLTEHCGRRYRTLIRNTPPNISEPLRVNSFRLSEVNLVFHSPANVTKGIVVERFAEALAMGGLIFHDHPRIDAEFPGLPSLTRVETANDIDRRFAELMEMTESERDALRAASWHAWQTSGLSYFDQARRVLDAFGLAIPTC